MQKFTVTRKRITCLPCLWGTQSNAFQLRQGNLGETLWRTPCSLQKLFNSKYSETLGQIASGDWRLLSARQTKARQEWYRQKWPATEPRTRSACSSLGSHDGQLWDMGTCPCCHHLQPHSGTVVSSLSQFFCPLVITAALPRVFLFTTATSPAGQ